MTFRDPTPILRFVHIDNLDVALRRNGLYAPNFAPDDGLRLRAIHNVEIQEKRKNTAVPCGIGGVIHDYVPFYFGMLSPMMLQLKSGKVAGYDDGQEPLIYLASTAQAVHKSGAAFAFSDGHGVVAYTSWYSNLTDLDKVDWTMVYQRYWADNINDMDRQRRKQAEFLVHKFCDWSLILQVCVISSDMQSRVEQILAKFDPEMARPVTVRPDWYF